MKNYNVSKKYSEQIENSINKIDIFCKNTANQIKLNNNLDKKNFIDIEIKKSFLKGVLRYHKLTNELMKNLLYEFKKINFIKDYNWVTRLYPMIHLSNDILEAEDKLHYDQEGNSKMFTCWLPITNYNYNGLNIFKYENFFTKISKKLLARSNFANKFTYSPDIKKGNFFLWSGNRLHKGNLNISKSIACAFQMKISCEPYLTEPSLNILQDTLEDKEYLDNENYLDLYLNYEKFLSKINKYSHSIKSINLISIKDVIKILRNDFISSDKLFSFSLSILSQRLRKLRLKNYDSINHINCHMYDLISTLIGSENLISLKRILHENKKLYDIFNDDEIFKEINFLNVCQTDTKQWHMLTKKDLDKKKNYLNYEF